MTREEAFQHVEKHVNDNWKMPPSSPYKQTVLVLEALGLIKFDEPVLSEPNAILALRGCVTEINSPPSLKGFYSTTVAGGLTAHGAGCVLSRLHDAGYRIVKEYEVANGWIGPGREPLSGLKKSSS